MFKYLLLIFFIISTPLFATHTNEKSVDIALYGLDKNTATAKTVKKMLLKLFQKIEKLENFSVNTFFYDDEQRLINDFISRDRKFDILYTVPITYIKNYNTFNKYGNDFAILKNHDKYVQYYLIKNTKTKAKKLEHLKSRKLVTASSDEFARVWLDYIFLNETKRGYKTFFRNEQMDSKMYKKVLDVYFNKIDLAVIPKHIWDTTIDLNPKITKNIEVFRKSQKIFPAIIGVFHRDVDPQFIETYNEFINNPKNKDFIFDILNLVKLNGVELMKKDDYNEALEFYLNYHKIKEKIK